MEGWNGMEATCVRAAERPDGRAASLHGYLEASARRRPGHTAVEDPGVGAITYAGLDALSDRMRDRLRHAGVRPGDRVGICLRKSIDAVAAIFGIMKCGAAHVPVDASAPPERNAYILRDCQVRAVIVESASTDAIVQAWEGWGEDVALLAVERTPPAPEEATPPAGARLAPLDQAAAASQSPAWPLARLLDRLQAEDPAPPSSTVVPDQDDLAYILYTSGSTGRPKGVMISHRNALCFVEWCGDAFEPRDEDRFSSHAPFHFDLSVLDIYVPLRQGATLVLISETAGKDPVTLARLISETGITCWYSTPSVLSLLTQFGHLERYDYSRLRIVHFAGEVFPIRHLRALRKLWPQPRYFNLYGPTETNVCTFFEVPARIPDDRLEPYPIGRTCPHYRARVVDEDGQDAAPGQAGELWISGPGVMRGYWGAPGLTEAVLTTDARGASWYHTGDVVTLDGSGDFLFAGRRDRMVKKRGFRIELGEIEAALYRHPEVKEAAVIAVPDEESGVKIRAFLAFRSGKVSIIRLKQFCGENLIGYMVPDEFVALESLPKTSTDKTDYQTLRTMP